MNFKIIWIILRVCYYLITICMNFCHLIKLPKSVGGKKKKLKIEIFNYSYIICSVTEVDFHAIPLVFY